MRLTWTASQDLQNLTGSVASKSEFELADEEDADAVRRPWYKRFAFWRTALPTLFSLLALGAALTLLLVPQFHFTTTVGLWSHGMCCPTT